MKKIGFIITTFLRDDLLFQSFKEAFHYSKGEHPIIVVDQNPSELKKEMFGNYIEVPYNSGLSYSRNRGVEAAKRLGCDYVVILADSIQIETIVDELDPIIQKMEQENLDIVGLPLSNRIGWEADLDLIEGKHFLLTFIKKEKSDKLIIQKCEICRNFFIAKIDVLLEVPWDEQFLMGEHEDEFMRLKLAYKKIGFTNKYKGKYIGTKPLDYSSMRRKNFNEGLNKLRKKYNISGWVEYKNIEYTKDN